MFKVRVHRMLVVLMASLVAISHLHAQFGPGAGYPYIPQDAYAVIAEIQAKPGKADELRAVTLPLITLVRSDPKNLVYFLQEDRDRPGHFVFYEIFATKADFEAHNAQPYVKEWFTKLPQLTIGSLKTTRFAVQTRSRG